MKFKLINGKIYDPSQKINGEIKNTWFGKTVIHSNQRFTYEQAQEIIKGKEHKFSIEINTLNTIAKTLRYEYKIIFCESLVVV